MKLVELAVALIVLALSALGLTEAIGFRAASAYLPTAFLGLACLLSIAWATQSVLAIRREPPTFQVDRAEARRLVTLATLSVLYALGIGWIGFFTSTVIFLPVAAMTLGYRDPRGLAIATAAFIGLLYAVFGLLLRTPLPPELILELVRGDR